MEASRVTDEALRLAAEAVRSHDIARSGGTASTTLLISERVGSVSQEFLDGMTREEKKRLDTSLRKIVVATCTAGCVVSWVDIASMVRAELATVGFQFATDESLVDDNAATLDWCPVTDVYFSDLKRVNCALAYSRGISGPHWIGDEMLRIVRRLIALRGFSP